MKAKQLLFLLVALGALILVAFLARGCHQGSTGQKASGKRAANRDVVFPDLAVNDVARITVTDDDGVVTAQQSDTGWTLPARDGYGADFGRIRDVISSIGKLDIAQDMVAGDSVLGRLGLLEPGSSPDTATTGTKVELFGKDDSPMATLILGNSPKSGSGESAPGRFVKNLADAGVVWVVSEKFSKVSTKTADWISKDFFKLANLQSIDMTCPDPSNSWTASRPDPAGQFTISDVAEGMETDPSKVSSFNYLLSSPSFQDLVSAEEATAFDFSTGHQVVLKTFDGFQYDLQILEEPQAEGATGSKAYLVKVDTKANLKTTREPVEGETEEAKKAADDAFAKELETLQKKLAAEQALAGHVYKVSEYTFTSLLKNRGDLIKPVEAPAPAGAGAPGAPGQTVTSPPVGIDLANPRALIEAETRRLTPPPSAKPVLPADPTEGKADKSDKEEAATNVEALKNAAKDGAKKTVERAAQPIESVVEGAKKAAKETGNAIENAAGEIGNDSENVSSEE